MYASNLKIGIFLSLLLVVFLAACDNVETKKGTSPEKTVAAKAKDADSSRSDSAAAPESTESKQDSSKDPVAAIVNGVEISRLDFENTLKVAKEQFASIAAEKGIVPDSVNIEKEVIERLISIELMLQDAKKRGITVDKVALDGQMAGFRNDFKTEKEFTDYMKENKITVDIVKAQITKQMTLQQLQEALLQEMKEKIKVTEKDSKAFYDANLDKFNHPDQVKASHILIKVDPKADKAAVKQALSTIEDIRKKAIAGEDFAELAKKNSQGESNIKGGDLGFFSKGKLQKPFEDAAFTLQPNEISKVVKTELGYHIIKVTERRAAGVIPFAEVKDKINQYLSQRDLDQAQQQYTEDMRKNAKVEIKI
jgi:peptidyl-prolyl cis-trans isomerase C